MKLKATPPSKRRAKRVGKTFGAIGTFLGALPVTVRPGKPDRSKLLRSKLLRVLVPAALLGALAAGIAQRRRARASLETWSSETTGTDSGFDPTAGASGASTGTESSEASTQTELRKDEAAGSSGEGVTETARGAAGETPASSEAGGSETS